MAMSLCKVKQINTFWEGNKNEEKRNDLFVLQDIEFIGRAGLGFVLSKPGSRWWWVRWGEEVWETKFDIILGVLAPS